MTIYLGNIPYRTALREIAELLAPFGSPENVRIPRSEASRGIAFADLPEAEALRAIAGLDGTTFGGRRLTVTEAHPPRRRDAVMSEVRA